MAAITIEEVIRDKTTGVVTVVTNVDDNTKHRQVEYNFKTGQLHTECTPNGADSPVRLETKTIRADIMAGENIPLPKRFSVELMRFSLPRWIDFSNMERPMKHYPSHENYQKHIGSKITG